MCIDADMARPTHSEEYLSIDQHIQPLCALYLLHLGLCVFSS